MLAGTLAQAGDGAVEGTDAGWLAACVGAWLLLAALGVAEGADGVAEVPDALVDAPLAHPTAEAIARMAVAMPPRRWFFVGPMEISPLGG